MKQSSKYAIAFVAAFGLFMAILDTTIVNVALTPIARSLKADLNSIQWIVIVYFLAQAAVIPVAGYLGSRFGVKRTFLVSLTLFTVGSLLCSLSQNLAWLVLCRAVQGAGGGALFSLVPAIALQPFPPKERIKASAIISIPVLLAPAFGPLLGGLLSESLGWEFIFLVNLPVGGLAFFLAVLVLPTDTQLESSRQAGLDFIGLGLAMVGVVLLVMAFSLTGQVQPGTATSATSQGQVYGWGYWLVWVLAGAGLLLLLIFTLYERRFSREAVLDLGLFKNFIFTFSSLLTWIVMIVVMGGSMYLLSIFLQQVRSPGLSALQTGLALIPLGIGAAVGAGLSGKFYQKYGGRRLIFTGMALLLVSSWPLLNLTGTTDGAILLPWLIVRGFGLGFTAAPLQTLALETLSGSALARASSLFNTTRQIFNSLGIALLTTVFVQQTAQYTKELSANQSPVQAAVSGMNDAFGVVAFLTLVALLVTLALPARLKEAVESDEKELALPT